MLINKSIFLNAMICPIKGWYSLHDKDIKEFTLGEQLRIDEGVEIGKLARKVFPDGQLISEKGKASVEHTAMLIKDDNVSVLFEAAFSNNTFITRADILKKEADGWHLIEVKSSTDFSQQKNKKKQEELIDDLAYTLMVINDSIPIKKISLITLSKDFRLGMELKKLFIITDVTERVLSRKQEFNDKKLVLAKVILAKNMPTPKWIYACKKCEFFKSKCLGKGIENPIFNLPRINEKKCETLFLQGCHLINDIPVDFKLSEKQYWVTDCTKEDQVYSDTDNMKSEFNQLIWPVYYLDFETVKLAVPLYENVAPHEQVLTQYSLHRLDSITSPASHTEYFADAKKDCRKELAEHLINHIGSSGSVLVYSNFEKTMLENLRKKYPDISEDIQLIIDRLADLKVIIENNYYHPKFKGSYSIKNVLPVLVPSMSYESLEVKNGEDAIATFIKINKEDLSDDEIQRMRNSLLKYCEQDTLAMVELHKALLEIVNEY